MRQMIDNAITKLLDMVDLDSGQIANIFASMEIVEDEIARACKAHPEKREVLYNAFRACQSPVIDRRRYRREQVLQQWSSGGHDQQLPKGERDLDR